MSALDAIAKKLLKTQELKALQQQKLGIDSVLDNEIKSEAGNTQTSPARTAVTEISGNICTGGGGVPSPDPLKVQNQLRLKICPLRDIGNTIYFSGGFACSAVHFLCTQRRLRNMLTTSYAAKQNCKVYTQSVLCCSGLA